MPNLTPSQEQVMSLLRQLLPALGTVAVLLGWVTPDAVAPWVAVTLSIAGPVMIIAGWVWSLFKHTQTQTLKAAAALPEVTIVGNTIVINDPALAQAIRDMPK